MPLTPIDIQQKTFGPELRGYNMDEVDDFLDDVVVALKDYDQRLRDAEDRIRALEAELSTRGEDESAISRALVTAQKQADSLVAEARVDAEKIRADAEGEADELRADRESEKMSLTQDIARMRATVADMKRRIVELATAVSSDLDEMDQAAAEAANGIGSDLTDVSNGSSDEHSGTPGYLGASVGAGIDPFADTDAESVRHDEPSAVGSYGRSGQHLSAVHDDYEVGDDDDDEIIDVEVISDSVDDDFDDSDDDFDSGVDAVTADAGAPDYGFDDDDDEAVAESSDDYEVGDDASDDEAGDDDAGDDDAGGDADEGDPVVSKFTERRPWERGSV